MFIILTLELIEVGAVTTALSFVHTAVSLLLHRWFPSYRGQNVSCCPSFWNNDPLNSFGDELLSGSVNFLFYLFVSFFFSITTTFSVATTPHSGRFSTHRSHSIWGTGFTFCCLPSAANVTKFRFVVFYFDCRQRRSEISGEWCQCCEMPSSSVLICPFFLLLFFFLFVLKIVLLYRA